MATPIIADYRRRYGDIANFAYVYISEAHASNEWPLGSVESHIQPQKITERVKLAHRFRDEYVRKADQNEGDIPVYVDCMDNAFDQHYAVWPERFFIIENDTIMYIGEPCTELGFDRGQIETWLEKQRPDEMEPSHELESKNNSQLIASQKYTDSNSST
mmetsp:Transcript_4871/g.6262  ORF Transcript_4871/g.6262 Transcript_4871/m.6262 type:complete len:159 (+) Transcript_4871:648-1124(+)|eukprot:CAMPEP_0114359916 /NCGR_PEP_ID=MMETSP0101-20121206/23399_1 /TAXON_ID=38822 ORGANISM="Pteridomonas danica, Strain PT" /NCGR_SAMPLE_ID=MMETSP0101 /ASSEMBLY_ACC=CAM_ASM_000211 /LENGTH=158 /DNA_ID=CAMNT_0001503745 /DNA_START=646 /DNA_END=1122 /DNA_ORIENTATION=-